MQQHQAFFSETNLEVLCKVAASTFPSDRPFDAGSSADRQRLYEAMHTVFTSADDASAPLSALNKQVLRTMLVRVAADAERTTEVAPAAIATASPPASPVVVRRGSTRAAGIRDLETHSRPVPTTFQARPQQTSMAAFDGTDADGGIGAGGSGGARDFQAQLQAYESTRAADTPADRVDPVDFALDAETDALDGDEATRRMEALMAARETVGVDGDDGGGGDGATVGAAATGATDADRQTGLAAAMERFDAQAVQVDAEVEAEQARQDTQRQTDERAFRATQVYRDSRTEGGAGAAEAEAEAEGDEPTAELVPAEDLATSGAYWLDETVRLNLDVNGRPKVDQCAFQDALQLTREERALNEKLRVQAPTLHEHLLLPPPKEYVTHTHFLEVSSSDRVRTLNVTETPYDFTVYFGTTMPAWRTYPVWLNNPIDYDTEEPETADIRRSLGLRGLPLEGGYTLDITKTTPPEFVEVQIPSQSQTNVDTVFKNVVAFKVNSVQLYFSNDSTGTESTCYEFPYLLLEINDFANVYRSTNNAVRKSFCKLYYDKSNCTLPVASKHHEYLPKYSEGMTFTTPLASIDRLQFRVLDPTGNAVSTAQDTYFVTEVSVSGTLITVKLYHHIPDKTVVQNDLVRFKDLEWYAVTEWDDWYQSARVQSQIDKYEDVQTKYTNALKAVTTNEDRRKLRAQFEKDQVDFDYPTLGYNPVNQDLVNIKACLERPEGHRIKEHKAYPDLHTLTIQIPVQFDPETGVSTQSLPVVPAQYTLMNGVMLHETRTTNISLTVVERDVAPMLEAINT
jgi:hypothetical protein